MVWTGQVQTACVGVARCHHLLLLVFSQCRIRLPVQISRFDDATLQIDESLLEGQSANLKLRRDEIYACNAATLVLASRQADEDDLGDVEPMTLQTYLRGAEGIGITLPDASFGIRRIGS